MCFSVWGSIIIFVLFTSLNVQTTTHTIKKPLLSVYRHLQESHPNEINCPCSHLTMPYSTFTTLSLRIHQICSSAFVRELWISLWSPRLLSNLCQLINVTVNDTMHRFTKNSFVTPNIMDEVQFNAQLNSSFNQLNKTLITNFNLLIDAVLLFIQVDQPFTVPINRNTAFDKHFSNGPHPFSVEVHNYSDQSKHSFHSIISCICSYLFVWRV